jgi:hypothetical protein
MMAAAIIQSVSGERDEAYIQRHGFATMKQFCGLQVSEYPATMPSVWPRSTYSVMPYAKGQASVAPHHFFTLAASDQS